MISALLICDKYEIHIPNLSCLGMLTEKKIFLINIFWIQVVFQLEWECSVKNLPDILNDNGILMLYFFSLNKTLQLCVYH